MMSVSHPRTRRTAAAMKHAVDPNGTLRSIDAVLTDNLRWRAKAAFDRLIPDGELCGSCARIADGWMRGGWTLLSCPHRCTSSQYQTVSQPTRLWLSGDYTASLRSLVVDGIVSWPSMRHHAMVEIWDDDCDDCVEWNCAGWAG